MPGVFVCGGGFIKIMTQELAMLAAHGVLPPCPLAPALKYPGTLEGLDLFVSINTAPFEEVALGADIYCLYPGDLLDVCVFSSFGTFTGIPVSFYALFASFVPTVLPCPLIPGGPVFPGLQINLASFAVPLFVDGASTPIPGFPVLFPAAGACQGYVYPGGLGGTTVIMQGLVGTPIAVNGIFAGTNGCAFVLN